MNTMHGAPDSDPPAADAAAPSPDRPFYRPTSSRSHIPPPPARPGSVAAGRRAGPASLPTHRTIALSPARRRPVDWPAVACLVLLGIEIVAAIAAAVLLVMWIAGWALVRP